MLAPEWYEEQRALLQRIHDTPATECEIAFNVLELKGKSQPNDWHAELCGMHGLMWRVFQLGWKANEVQPHCSSPEGCYCGGDADGVRATCPSWHTAGYETIKL